VEGGNLGKEVSKKKLCSIAGSQRKLSKQKRRKRVSLKRSADIIKEWLEKKLGIEASRG